MSKALFFLPNADQTVARHFTHIDLIQREGVLVDVIAFSREAGVADAYSDRLHHLSRVSHGNYINRALVYLKSLRRIRRYAKNVDFVFTYTLDCYFLFKMATGLSRKKPLLVFFWLDVRPGMYSEGFFGWLNRRFLIKLFKSADFVIVSSHAFVKEFANAYLGEKYLPERWAEVENKVLSNTSSFVAVEGKYRPEFSTFTIGYFGLLRCSRAIQILYEFLSERKDVNLVIAGLPLGIEDGFSRIVKLPNVKFLGEYRNPEDLPELYGSIDLVWSAYPYSGSTAGNQKWAKTNRYYEAGYFKVPQLASKNSQDGRQVCKLGIGKEIELGSIEGAVAQLNSITLEDLTKWRLVLEQLDRSHFSYSTEFKSVVEVLNA